MVARSVMAVLCLAFIPILPAVAANRNLLQTALAKTMEVSMSADSGADATAAAYDAVTRSMQQRAASLTDYASQSRQAASQRLGAAASQFRPSGNATDTSGADRNAASATKCGNGVCDANEDCSVCPQDCKRANGQPCNRVGILYSGWHWPAWTATENVRKKGHTAYDVEDILRSQTASTSTAFRGTTIGNMLNRDSQSNAALNFYWHARPQQNFYCIYHRRNPGNQLYNKAHEGSYLTYTNVPDCANWQSTVQTHARQLWAAGIDNAVYDATNIDTYDPVADALQLRPLQILFEEWSNMRAAGTQTPDIAAWQRIPFKPTKLAGIDPKDYSFYYVLMLMNTKSYDRLVLRDPTTQKKIFYYPALSAVDSSIIDYIESNGGRNDVLAVPMWVGQQSSGSWNFFAFCKTLIFMENENCAQAMSTFTVKTKGSQLAVSPSYQTTFAGIEWQSIGQWEGLTLKKQFATAISSKPQWIFISSWNEHIAQPQQSQGLGDSMGLAKDPAFSSQTFVDIHGASFGRDIEPTVEGDSMLYDLTASCIRAFRTAVAKNSNTCPANEACCQGLSFTYRFKYYDGGSGRFGLRANIDAQRNGKPVTETKALKRMGDPGRAAYTDGRTGLYECSSKILNRPPFLSNNYSCDSIYKAKYLIVKKVGYIQTSKGRGFLRPLMRCLAPNKWRNTYTLGPNCPSPNKNDKVLGYVR